MTNSGLQDSGPAAAVTAADKSTPAASPWPYLLVIVALWAVIYVSGLFQPALLDDADSVHAEAAREMVLTHDWVTLHADGVRYMEKAPLMYWGMAASFKLFGVSEWAARLPLTLGMLALLLAAYALGKEVYGNRAGLYAAIILATGFGPYIFTRILIPDVLVGLWLTLSFWFFLRTLRSEHPSRFDCWGLAAATALNVLTKGLIGVVFPVGVIVLLLLLTRNLKHLLRMRLVSSTLVFLAIAAPWHILAGLRNPDVGNVHGFFWFYFVNEHILRYLGLREPKDYDTVPLAVFWGLVLVWIMPWSAFVLQAAGQVWHRKPGATGSHPRLSGAHLRRWREFLTRVKHDPQQRAILLLAIWTVAIVLFFSFSTRQEYYTIPALPGLALLIAGWMAKEEAAAPASAARRWGRISSTVLLAIGVSAFAVAAYLLHFAVQPPRGYDLADLLKKNPSMYALSFGHVFDLTPQALGAFRWPLLGFGLSLLLGTGLNWWFRRRGRVAAGNAALTAMMILVLFCVHFGLVEFSPTLTSKPLALAVKRVYRPGDVIVINAEYEPGSTMNFYTGEPVHIMRKFGNLWYGSFFPDAPKVYETPESLSRLWSGSTRVFLWSDEEQPKVLEGKPWYEFARSGGKHIYTNKRF